MGLLEAPAAGAAAAEVRAAYADHALQLVTSLAGALSLLCYCAFAFGLYRLGAGRWRAAGLGGALLGAALAAVALAASVTLVDGATGFSDERVEALFGAVDGANGLSDERVEALFGAAGSAPRRVRLRAAPGLGVGRPVRAVRHRHARAALVAAAGNRAVGAPLASGAWGARPRGRAAGRDRRRALDRPGRGQRPVRAPAARRPLRRLVDRDAGRDGRLGGAPGQLRGGAVRGDGARRAAARRARRGAARRDVTAGLRARAGAAERDGRGRARGWREYASRRSASSCGRASIGWWLPAISSAAIPRRSRTIRRMNSAGKKRSSRSAHTLRARPCSYDRGGRRLIVRLTFPTRKPRPATP
jgi:hypothetical protein